MLRPEPWGVGFPMPRREFCGVGIPVLFRRPIGVAFVEPETPRRELFGVLVAILCL